MPSLGEEPPFKQIAIVGFGLIGGSIALAIRERWPSIRITAVDRPPVLAHAAGSGAIDRAAQAVTELSGNDLVVLAAPVEQNIRLLPDVFAVLADGATITDVGGTKRDIVKAAAALRGARASFVGGHPIGGAERGGFAFARADLFRGRPWILTPNESTSQAAIDRLSGFIQSFGARPTTMDAEEHDRLMAFLSHLPQLTVSALMEVVGEATSSSGLRLAGRGLVDSTRLASSPADIWRDVCASNAGDIGVALDRLITRLQELRASLSDGAAVDAVFERAAHWRSELMKGRE
ncbi:MAG TPA: prephenate dehydrogenase/arogenate dehydrogenase family protein [Vicinamibacterales bacterium]|nr:prephenate dehydrogenase/arogenate dehydrogenase family protein [Vicinamibacterales bacterium]